MSDNEKVKNVSSNSGANSTAQGQDKNNSAEITEPDSKSPPRFGDTQEPASESQQLQSVKADAEKFKSEFMYLRAEFENYKRNVIKERSDLRKYGAEKLIQDLIGVLDIFEAALGTEMNADNFLNFKKGIEMTANELRGVLNRNGVTEVPCKGQPFDPAFHEALSSEETSEAQPGTITQVYKKAFKLHDRVVRPAQVVVAKAKS